MPDATPYQQVPISEAAGGVGIVQILIAAAVVVYAVVLIARPPATRHGALIIGGVVAAFLPIVVGHLAMLVSQMRMLGGMSNLGPAASQKDMIHGMEAASVHTWVGWTASGVAVPAILLARWRLRRAAAAARAAGDASPDAANAEPRT